MQQTRRAPAPALAAAATLAAAAVLAGAVGFVTPAQAPREAPSHALRGAAARGPAAGGAASEAGASGWLAAAAVVSLVAAVPRGCRRPKAATVCRAAAAEVEEAEPPFDPSKQVGVTLPLMYFDPAGFCKEGDKETFYNYRCAELKHGRVAMIASMGAVAQHWIKFPGFEDVPSGLGAVITPPGTFGLVALVALAGGIETAVWVQDPDKEPGDFGDPAGFGQYYEEWRNRELNNCRMAMISITAIIVTELVTGLDGISQIWRPLSNLPVE